MRILIAIVAMFLWVSMLLLLGFIPTIEQDTLLITLAIVAAGAMAGGGIE